jgi:nitrogen regulatory protein PII 2
MKEIVAVIRMNRINDTKKALAAVGIGSMNAKECLGRGKGLVDFKMLAGAEKGYEEAIAQLGQSQRLVPKRMVSIVVQDKLVNRTVHAIIQTNQTNKAGDGKIFVLPVSEAYRVRTGDEGDAILDEA